MNIDYAKKTGVYGIVNLINWKMYVGSTSSSFANRFRNHLLELRKGDHHSSHLQRAWNKYGSDAFFFHPIQECCPSDCISVEQTFIDLYRPEYNISPLARSAKGVVHTERSRRRMSEGLRKARAAETPARREERRQIVIAAMNTPSAKEARRIALNQPESLAARSRGMQALWANEEFKKEQILRMRAAAKTPEARENKSKSVQLRMRSESSLTPSIVFDIMCRIANGEMGSVLAREYGVGQTTISRIKRGDHWSLSGDDSNG